MEANVKLGRLIRMMRKELGMTQEELANELFISQTHLRNIELGKVNCSVNMADKIIRYLLKKREQQNRRNQG